MHVQQEFQSARHRRYRERQGTLFPDSAHRAKEQKSLPHPGGCHYLGDFVLITLPCGKSSDWVKNVLSAGGCGIFHKGQTYTATNPQVLPLEDAKKLMPAGKKAAPIKKYLRLSITPALPSDPKQTR